MKNNIKSFIAFDFIALLFIFFLLNTQYFLDFFNFSPIHDTAVTHQIFYFFYNEFYTNNIIQLWLPYSLYGGSSDIAITTAIAPAQFFMMVVGKLLHIKDSLMLFKVSLVLEGLALFVGVYFLAKRFFQHYATIIFVSLGAIATTYWGIEVSFFRMYYLMPLCLYFLTRFFDLYDFKCLWIACIVAVISLIGNITYFAPLFLLIFVTFMFLLFIIKRNHAAFKMRNIFTIPSLGLLSVFILLSVVYVDYTLHMFDYIRIYSPGRNPLDSKTTLETFLTYGAKTQARALLEFVYAIPFSTDFFIYIGLIPLVFLIFAAFHLRGIKRDNPVFIPLLVISIVLILFSLGAKGCIAYLLYYAFPGMSYFRHIGYVKVIAKILFLLASGFGIDYYLNTHRYDSTDRGNSKLKKYSPVNIGIVLVGLIVIVNITVFILKFTTNKIIYPLNNYLPYQFHLFSIFILVLFCYFLLKQFNNKRIISHVIVTFYFIEIVAYCFVMSYSLPAKGIKPQVGNTIKTAEYSNGANLFKTAFNVRKYPFRNDRVNQDRMYTIRPEMPLVLQTYMPGIFAVYFHIYSAFYVDSCLQEYRTDYMPLSFDHLIRARLGIAFDSMNVMPSIDKDHYFMQAISKDEDFMRAIGCNTSKIRFVLNPVIVPDLNAAAMMIKESPDLNEKPIILESSNSEYGRLLLGESRRLESQPTSLRHNGKPKDSLKSANPVNTKSLDIKFDVIKFTANMIEIAADTGSYDKVWLVYLDNYHPKWKATVNGKPASIARANIAFKAVKLEKGYNIVRFTFENLRNKIYMMIFFILGVISSLILIISVIFLSIPSSYNYIRGKVF